MVKSVVGEEPPLKTLENRLYQSSVAAQVGIVIGKVNPNSDRGFVYDLIPTPLTDSGSAACSLKSEPASREEKKKGSKGGKPSNDPPPSLLIDGDWVAEHARQVSRMLMGGMNVVGVFLWASESAFKATSPSIISQTVRAVAKAAPWCTDEIDERLLIHISFSPSRWACRNCTVGSSNMRPCDFKMGKLLASLQTYRCMYNFEIRLPIFHVGASDSSTFKNVIGSGIARHAKELQNAKALIDGKLVTEDQCITSEGIHKVELLLPFMKDDSAEAFSSDEVDGIVVLTGSICASAYLGPKEHVSQAVSDLKGDIISSLRSRLDIISDEADDKADLTSNYGGELTGDVSAEKGVHLLNLRELRKPYCLSFPRRVFVPWLAGTFICDYLQKMETFEDLKDRCKEMMAIESPIETSAILEPETEATAILAKSFWDVVNGGSTSSQPESKNVKNSTKSDVSEISNYSGFNLVTALLILLVALLVGFAITALGQKKSVR